MNKRKIKKLTYKYFEQYNIEYFSIPQIDDIDIFNNSESFGQFDIDTMYKRQYILKVDSTLFDEKESFIKQILFHEFTHMYDSLKFLDYDKETFKKLMNIYSEIHATEIEMNVILSTKNGNIITTHESMTLKNIWMIHYIVWKINLFHLIIPNLITENFIILLENLYH